MKKPWRAVVLGAATALLFTTVGCSTDSGPEEKPSSTGGETAGTETETETPSEPSTLEVWMPTPFGGESTGSEEATWKEMLAPFEEANNTTINITLVPWDSYEEKYLTGVSSGEGPAVGYMYTEMMGDYIANGALAAFDDYFDPEAAGTMLYLEQGKVDGAQYAMPFVVGGMRILWANMDILEEAGVAELPTSWDDFNDANAKVKSAGYTPLLQEWGAPERGMLNSTFFPALWQAGGDILSPDGTKTAFDSEAGVEAANFIMNLLETGAMPDTVSGNTEEDVKDAFYSGKTAFMYGNDGTKAEIDEAGINADFIPSLKGKEFGTFVASDSLVMLEGCPDKQLCTDLTQFILAGPQMTLFHSGIVPYPPVGTDEVPDPDNIFAPVYAEFAPYLHSLPVAAGSAPVYNSLYVNLQQMVLGQKTPEEALKDAAAEGDAALEAAQ